MAFTIAASLSLDKSCDFLLSLNKNDDNNIDPLNVDSCSDLPPFLPEARDGMGEKDFNNNEALKQRIRAAKKNDNCAGYALITSFRPSGVIRDLAVHLARFGFPLALVAVGERNDGNDNDDDSALTFDEDPTSHDSSNAKKTKTPDTVDAKTKVKRKCAAALLNMSLREQMETQFVNEGGLKSLLELALSTTDHETLKYCMSCILNLAGEGSKDTKLFDFNIIAAITQLYETTDDVRVEQYVAKSLCFFTMLDSVEERIVSEGIIVPLAKILHSKNPVSRMIACKGLINLTHCLTGSTADSVNKNIVVCLKKLCVLQIPFISYFCAHTVQILSALPLARQKIGEEGAIEVLNTLIREFTADNNNNSNNNNSNSNNNNSNNNNSIK